MVAHATSYHISMEVGASAEPTDRAGDAVERQFSVFSERNSTKKPEIQSITVFAVIVNNNAGFIHPFWLKAATVLHFARRKQQKNLRKN